MGLIKNLETKKLIKFLYFIGFVPVLAFSYLRAKEICFFFNLFVLPSFSSYNTTNIIDEYAKGIQRSNNIINILIPKDYITFTISFVIIFLLAMIIWTMLCELIRRLFGIIKNES